MSPRIPFRVEAAVDATYIVGVFLATGALLLIAVLLLSFARRKGWLDRWRVGGPSPSRAKANMWSIDSQRISRQTSIHTLRNGRERLIIVESAANVAVSSVETESMADGVSRAVE